MQPMPPATLSEPFFFRIANAVWGFSQRYWKLIVVAMLALLHVAVFRGVADPWARALLLALLAIAILPEIAPRREIAREIRTAAEYALPLMFVLIALFPAEAETIEAAQVIDFFYSVMLMLVLVVVVLGSFTFMTVTRSG